MRTACEAVIHTAVVSPVVVLAGLIEAATGAVKIASTAADRLAGTSPPKRTGAKNLHSA